MKQHHLLPDPRKQDGKYAAVHEVKHTRELGNDFDREPYAGWEAGQAEVPEADKYIVGVGQ
jgi:hypothetical protein